MFLYLKRGQFFLSVSLLKHLLYFLFIHSQLTDTSTHTVAVHEAQTDGYGMVIGKKKRESEEKEIQVMEGDRREGFWANVKQGGKQMKQEGEEEEGGNSTMERGKEEAVVRRDGREEGGDEEAKRGSVKRGRRLRQAVHISWLPLIIRAFP